MLAGDYITGFQPISLEAMDAVKLMNRIDTKYVMSKKLLPGVLDRITFTQARTDRERRTALLAISAAVLTVLITAHREGCGI